MKKNDDVVAIIAIFIVAALVVAAMTFTAFKPQVQLQAPLAPAEPPELSKISLPPGFKISILADGLTAPRFMAINGDALYVTEISAGRVRAISLSDPSKKTDFATGLLIPNGVTIYDGWVYVGESEQINRFKDTNNDGVADVREIVVKGLPTAGVGHSTRTIAFGPDNKMYVSVGSSCNVCIEDDERRAAIVRYNPDGTGYELFASGTRNAVGIRFKPGTGDLYGTENGRDWLGDDLPPEEINIFRQGRHYGWPFCYGDRIVDQDFGKGNKTFCDTTEPPAVEFQAHSAPLGLEFYTGTAFPREYWGDLFVAYHGSWNRGDPTGYKVVRMKFDAGGKAAVSDFAAGWLRDGTAFGRPVDVLTAPDGSLFVSDDKAGVIYKIEYTG
jgi:glucose/arabinose dehydrogenase